MSLREDCPAATVTVVDDEPALRGMLVGAIRSWHYSCQAAASAEHALQLFETGPTPIVITDLRMPGQGGVWLVQELRSRWPEVGVVVLTAGEDSDAAIECLNAGADRYLLKPVNLAELRHALESTLHRVLLERERERYREHLEEAVRRQTQRVRRTFLSAIDSLVRAVEARHPYTQGHSLRVRRYSLRLAAALGLDRRQRRQLSLAAKLHDIGKFGTPEAILNKPGALTAEEHAVIREHPVIGERILTPIIRSQTILAAIRGHHERLDGRGYPDGLKGPQIPRLARILAITDCFDALTSSRAYRPALPVPEALAILRRGAGEQFDPAFIEAFMRLRPLTLIPQEEAPAARSESGPAALWRTDYPALDGLWAGPHAWPQPLAGGAGLDEPFRRPE